MEGESLMPAFIGEEPNPKLILCFEHEEHCSCKIYTEILIKYMNTLYKTLTFPFFLCFY